MGAPGRVRALSCGEVRSVVAVRRCVAEPVCWVFQRKRGGGMAALMRSFALGRTGTLSRMAQRHGRNSAASYINRVVSCQCPARWGSSSSSSSDGSEARLLGGAPIKDAEAISHIAFAFMVRVATPI